MQLDKIRRMASDILKIGENKVWLDPEQLAKIKQGMTKEDVRGMIGEGSIKKRKEKEISRARARILHLKKKKGRKKGAGKRRGKTKARMQPKKIWMKNVRAQRKKLRELKGATKIKHLSYGKLYRMVGSGYFKSIKHLEQFAKGEAK